MRLLLAIIVSTALCASASTAKAQTHLPVPAFPYYGPGAFLAPAAYFAPNYNYTDSSNHKWQLRPFASLSLGYLFYKGGGMSYATAPVGIALLRPLNQNFTAFTDVSIAPTVFNINRLYTDPAANRSPFSGPYGLNAPARVELGLMYTNDAHTFTISGSVGVERDSYPVYYQPARTDIRKQ